MHINIKMVPGFILVVIIISAGLQSAVTAQDYGFGIKAGMTTVTQTGNFIFTDGNVNLDLSSRYMGGYSLGVFARLDMDDKWKLVTELNFSRFGASYDETFTFQNQNVTTVSRTGIRYFQVPVVVEWHTDSPDLGPFRYQRPYWSWNVKGGLYGGYRIDAVFSGTNTARVLGVEFESEFSNDVTDSYKAFDAGLTIGGGLEYGLNTKYGFETRLMMGLMDVGNNSMSTRNMGIVFSFYFVI